MIFAVSSAAAALRSTQNTCAPSRANVTAVALPLPQPGPIEPAPTTIAVFPLSRCIDFSLISFSYRSPDEAKRNPGAVQRQPRISQASHPGYGSHTRIVVTLAPTGCPKISDKVRQFPLLHSRHSPAAPELPSTTSGIGARLSCHRNQPPTSRASGGGSMPAPEPFTLACTSSRPFGVMRQSSCQSGFSIEWVQPSVKTATDSVFTTPAEARQRLNPPPPRSACPVAIARARSQPLA